MRGYRRSVAVLAFLFLLLVAALFATTALRVSFSGTEAEMAAAREAAEAAGVPLASWKTLVVAGSGSVGAPAAEVWDALSRPDDWPRWSAPPVLAARWAGDPGLRPGARLEQVRALGFPLGTVRSEELVTRAVPGTGVVWCSSGGGVTDCHVWRLVPVTPQRTFVVSVEVLHGGPVGFLAPFVQSRWSRLAQQGVSGLARYVEASGEAPAGAAPR